MKYMLMMTGTNAEFESYAKWPKQDLLANIAFMRAFSKELSDSGVFVSTEGLAFPIKPKSCAREATASPSPTGYFQSRKSSWPAIGLSTWRALSKLTRSPLGFRVRPGLEASVGTSPSKCGKCSVARKNCRGDWAVGLRYG